MSSRWLLVLILVATAGVSAVTLRSWTKRGSPVPTREDLDRAYEQAPVPSSAASRYFGVGLVTAADGLVVLSTALAQAPGRNSYYPWVMALDGNGALRWKYWLSPDHPSDAQFLAALGVRSWASFGEIQERGAGYRGHIVAFDDSAVGRELNIGSGGLTGLMTAAPDSRGGAIAGGMLNGKGWLVFLNEALAVVREQTLADLEEVRTLSPMNEDGRTSLLVTGVSSQPILENAKSRVMKIAADGTVVWKRQVPSDGEGEVIAATWTGGNVAISGHKRAKENRDERRAWMTMVTTHGGVLWEQSFGRAGESIKVEALVADPDGGVILLVNRETASKTGEPSSQGEAWVVDPEGQVQRRFVVRSAEQVGGEQGLVRLPDGDLVFLGTLHTQDMSRASVRIVRTDGLGNVRWDRTYQGP